MAIEGQMMSRFGSVTGRYASPVGTPYAMRSLSPSTSIDDYFEFEVIKPFKMQRSMIAPTVWDIGLGTQYKLPAPIDVMKDLGYIKY